MNWYRALKRGLIQGAVLTAAFLAFDSFALTIGVAVVWYVAIGALEVLELETDAGS